MDSQLTTALTQLSSPSAQQPPRGSRYSAPFLFNPRHYIRTLRTSSAQTIDPKELSEEAQTLLQSICSKFTFTD